MQWTMRKGILAFAGVLVAAGVAAWIAKRDAPAAGPAAGPPEKGQGRRGFDPKRAIPVRVAPARTGDIEITLSALGTVIASNTATVRSRVDGQLMRIAFREGQTVKAGDLLAEVDPRPFQVQLDQALGRLARDSAQLAHARLDLERYRGLAARDAIARQQVDAQEAQVLQSEAAVQTDRAEVEAARLQLAYARVTAPISGRLGLRLVDVGNIVRAGDAAGIVVITRTQPIHVVFAIPAEQLGGVATQFAKAGREGLRVEALDRDGGKVLATGRLATIDNQIDPATGTVRLKAEFANADEALVPNQFVNARLRTETRRGVTLVPVAAVQRGAQGSFVYVVGGEGTATLKPVTVGAVQGEQAAVEGALVAGEPVVIDGADKLRTGGKVEVIADSGGRGPAGEGRRGKGAGRPPGGAPAAAAGAPPAAPAAAAPAPAAPAGDAPKSGGEAASPEERQRRWAEINARIDRGEFGEEIRKLPEEERRQRMRELRRQREAGGEAGGPPRQ